MRFAVRGFRPGTSRSAFRNSSPGASLDRIIISKEALKNITPLSAGRNAARDPRSERGHALREQRQHFPKRNQARKRGGWKNKQWATKKGQERGGKPFTKNSLFRLLINVMYTGKVDYKGTIYNGEHDGIVDVALWQRVQVLSDETAAPETEQRGHERELKRLHTRIQKLMSESFTAASNGGAAMDQLADLQNQI